MPLLTADNVAVHFPYHGGRFGKRTRGTVKAVDGVSFGVERGEILGLVGESGCGKSTLARAILQLIRPTTGTVRFDGHDLTALEPAALHALRPRMQMVFQDPYASLNPRMTVFDALAEPLVVHRKLVRAERARRVGALMEQVGLAPRLMRKYPHEFSGGQRQRIAIARALALDPQLIIADEPVSALDVSVQAQILNLLARLRREHGLTMVLIAHDLAVVRHLADRIAVMYLGRIVELGPADDVYHRPRHPYTQALLSAVPVPDPKRERARVHRPPEGDPPSPLNPPAGCAFHPRCPHAMEACRVDRPPLAPAEEGRRVACVRKDELREG